MATKGTDQVMKSPGSQSLRRCEPDRPDRPPRVVAIDPSVTEAALAERISYVKAQAGPRADEITLSFGFVDVIDDPSGLFIAQVASPGSAESQVRALPTVLDGSVAAAAARIRRYHHEFGISLINWIVQKCEAQGDRAHSHRAFTVLLSLTIAIGERLSVQPSTP